MGQGTLCWAKSLILPSCPRRRLFAVCLVQQVRAPGLRAVSPGVLPGFKRQSATVWLVAPKGLKGRLPLAGPGTSEACSP